MTTQMEPKAAEPDQIAPQIFFDDMPPGTTAVLAVKLEQRAYTPADDNYHFEATFPGIEMHCEGKECNGRRKFWHRSPSKPSLTTRGTSRYFLEYVCKNCGAFKVYFAVELRALSSESIQAYKVGQVPPFGPPTPRRLAALVEEERDYYLKGRRAESQSMGIAAFAYYRRVIENQRNRIFDAVINVARKLKSPQEMLDDLEAAKLERQFTKGVERIRHGIPQVLLVEGHNPLLLLHDALSEGLHAGTDAECLSLASSIRAVLADLAERLSQAIKDDAELTAALGRLLKRDAKPGPA